MAQLQKLAVAVLLTAFGIAFPFGFHLGVINLTQTMLENFVNQTFYEENGHFMDETSLEAMWSFIVSSFTLGGAVGGLICPIFAEKLGRKLGLILAAGIQIVGTLLAALSKKSQSYELFTAGRTIAGLSVGIGATLLSIYLSEISPKHLRGFAGGFLEILLVFGKFSSQLLSLSFILGNQELWPYLMAIPIISSIVLILFLPFFPESPKYLRAKQKNPDSSPVVRSIRFYHGENAHCDEVIQSIDQELDIMKKELTLKQILLDPIFRQCLLMAVVIRLAQELTGITAIFNFSTRIFQTLQMEQDFAQYNSIGIAGMSAIVTTVAVFLVEHAGRRFLLVYGLLGTLICDLAFMIFALVNESTGYMWTGYACIVILYVHVFLFSCGPGPVGWLIVPELVPQVGRSGVTSAGVFVNWSSNLLVTAAFLPLKSLVGFYSFLMFIVPLGLSTGFLLLRLPETKNQPVDAIVEALVRKTRKVERAMPMENIAFEE